MDGWKEGEREGRKEGAKERKGDKGQWRKRRRKKRTDRQHGSLFSLFLVVPNRQAVRRRQDRQDRHANAKDKDKDQQRRAATAPGAGQTGIELLACLFEQEREQLPMLYCVEHQSGASEHVYLSTV